MMCTPRLVVTRSENSFASKWNAASSNAGSCSPRPTQPKWPVMLPGWAAVWQSDLSLQILPKEFGSFSRSCSAARAAASASPAVFAAPSRRAAGSTTRNCWCLKSTCRKKTDPAWPLGTFCRFAAGPEADAGSFGRFLASKTTHAAPTDGADGSASMHHRSAAAFGCLANPWAREASRCEGSPAVAPTSSARRQPRPPVGTVHEALSGSMATILVGKRRSRTPMARLVGKPTRNCASWRGNASGEPGLRTVSTASLHMAFARSHAAVAAAQLSNFSSRLSCHLHAFSASSTTCSVSHDTALSTPRSSAAPSRV
mmetsp:Transcript_63735/g.184857  ORF Transcript_63735/g.184857 Transcript_63735/m.184857 type:complete len:313 (-) Transcript_63735:1631-2569(-)